MRAASPSRRNFRTAVILSALNDFFESNIVNVTAASQEFLFSFSHYLLLFLLVPDIYSAIVIYFVILFFVQIYIVCERATLQGI